MVNDRGTMKWSTMMLPEHAEQLRILWEEDEKKQKPLPDTQQIELMNTQLLHAYTKQVTIEITIFRSNTTNTFLGKVKKIDKTKEFVHLKEKNGEIFTLPFHQIIDIQLNSSY